MRRAAPAAHGLVAIILTWPLAAHLTASMPFGTEAVETVPLFNLWTLRWDQHELGDLFRHYWDAPIFHPTAGAFALSEPQPLTGAAFAPIAWLTANPVLAYNLVLLVILTLNGVAAARLCRTLGVAFGPALLAGVMAQALPFVSNQLGVLQLTVLFPIFLTIDAVIRWAPGGGRRPAAAMGGWLAAVFLTCGYYGLFTMVVVGVSTLALVRTTWLRWSRLVDGAVAAAVFAVLAVPFLVGQAHYTSDYTRSESTIAGLSAEPIDFLHLHPDAHGASLLPWLHSAGGTGHPLYPGTVLLILAYVGFSSSLAATLTAEAPDDNATDDATGNATDNAAGHRDRPDGDTRRRLLFLVFGAVLALILSLGLHIDIGGFRPYDLLRLHVPGYRDLRSPFRFAVLGQIFLLPLAAMGLDACWARGRRWTLPRRPATDRASPDGNARARTVSAGALVAVAIVLVGVLEVSAVPQRLFTVEDPVTDWAIWLRDHPGAPDGGDTGEGTVAMVPFPATGAVASYEPTAQWMLSGLDHGHALVNGYSGLFPPQYDQLEADMVTFPDPDSLASLRRRGVSFVVVTDGWFTPDRRDQLRSSAAFSLRFTGGGASVYQLLR